VSTTPRRPLNGTLDVVKAQTLGDSAYERVRQQLVTCAIEPGSSFTENDIAQALQMSKTPVREALRRVCLEGLAGVRSRTGYVAAPVTLKGARDVCALRELLEGEAAAMVAAEHPEVGAQRLSEMNAAVMTPAHVTIGEDGVADMIEGDRVFHLELGRITGNDLLVRALENTLVHFSRLAYLCITLDGTDVVEPDAHDDLIAAIGAGHDVRARELVAEEIRDGERRIVTVFIGSHSVASAPVSAVSVRHRFYLDTPRDARPEPGREDATQ
jgi:GntR family transcriptional regulator, rspAB operon transcriptional repressor